MDVAAHVHDLANGTAAVPGWPAGFLPRAKLTVPGARKLQLPHHREGLHISLDEPIEGFSPEEAERSRSALLTAASFRAPLGPPTQEALEQIGFAPAGKHDAARRVLSSVAVRSRSGLTQYGRGELLVVENGVRLGSHAVYQLRDEWTPDRDQALMGLARALGGATENLLLGPEPGSRPWPIVVALLSGGFPEATPTWRRHVALAAGLLEVNLRLELDADAQHQRLLKRLRVSPPDGLLLWAERLRYADYFESGYQAAKPGGPVDRFGPSAPDAGTVASELVLHLELMVEGVRGDRARTSLSWRELETQILDRESEYFVISDRAKEQLKSNPYPDPDRMLTQLLALERTAAAYHAADGQIGERFADFAISNFGIEIALTDQGLDPPQVFVGGQLSGLVARPHVKVDDAKSPDKCGRIYFALDTVGCRVVVDHIGLHDYGR